MTDTTPAPTPPIQNQVEGQIIAQGVAYLQQQKPTLEPKLALDADNIVEGAANFLEQNIPFHGGVLKFLGDAARAAVTQEESTLVNSINTGGSGAYDSLVNDLAAFGGKVASGELTTPSTH